MKKLLLLLLLAALPGGARQPKHVREELPLPCVAVKKSMAKLFKENPLLRQYVEQGLGMGQEEYWRQAVELLRRRPEKKQEVINTCRALGEKIRERERLSKKYPLPEPCQRAKRAMEKALREHPQLVTEQEKAIGDVNQFWQSNQHRWALVRDNGQLAEQQRFLDSCRSLAQTYEAINGEAVKGK